MKPLHLRHPLDRDPILTGPNCRASGRPAYSAWSLGMLLLCTVASLVAVVWPRSAAAPVGTYATPRLIHHIHPASPSAPAGASLLPRPAQRPPPLRDSPADPDAGAELASSTLTLQPTVRSYLSGNGAVLLAGAALAYTNTGVLKDMIAGALASVCIMLLGYPLDTAKTRMQIGQKTLNEDGILGLYRGVGVGLLREASTAAIYLATCGLLKLALVPPDAGATLPTLLLFLFIGATACLASCTSRVPLEIISKQIQSGQSRTVGDATRRVFLSPDACTAIQRSWIAVMLREVPYGAFQIAFFELAKLLFTFLADWQVPILVQRMAWGAVAGSGAALLTTPFDVITSRVMLSGPAAGVDGPAAPLSVWGTVQKMYHDEGLGVFFTGGLLRALFYSPGTCIFFAVYETVSAAMK